MKSVTHIVAVSGILSAVVAAQAQTLNWTNPMGGSWGAAGNWVPASVPDTSGENARIGAVPGGYTVVVGGVYEIGRLLCEGHSQTLLIAPGADLSLLGADHVNNAVIRVHDGSAESIARLYFDQYDDTLAGVGRIVMQALPGVPETAVLRGRSQLDLVHAPDHTIEGHGLIEVSLINEGLVQANVKGRVLKFDYPSQSNRALMRATNEGILRFEGSVIQEPGGVVRAEDRSRVEIAGHIRGGLAETTGSGEIVLVTDSVRLGDVTLAGRCLTEPGCRVAVNPHPGFTNNGTFYLGQNAYLEFDHTATIAGNGSLFISGDLKSYGIGGIYTLQGAVAINGPEHTIVGSGGRLSGSLVNNGVVEARGLNHFYLLEDLKVNNNLMRTASRGRLRLQYTTVAQGQSGLILAQEEGIVSMYRATLVGGTLESVGDGLIHVESGIMSDVHIRGICDVEYLEVFGEGIRNDASIEVDSGYIRFIQAGEISGSGEILLYNRGKVTDTGDIASYPGQTVIHGPDHLIHGRGRIPAAIVNNGVINAGTHNYVIWMIQEPKVNNNLIFASNGGILHFEPLTVTQNHTGVIRAEDGSVVVLNGTTLVGGSLESTGDGRISVVLNETRLQDVTLSGVTNLDSSASLTLDSESTFACTLAGTSPDAHDRIAGEGGTVNLAGTLDIALADTFEPSPCDTFTIVTGASVIGSFEVITGVPAPVGHVWRIYNNGSSATLKLTCYPDIDGNCTLDLFDLLGFLNTFNAGDENADCDSSGDIDFFDVLCYLNELNAGC